MGTRVRNSDGTWAPKYEWKTYAEVWDLTQNIAKGMCALDLLPVQESINEDGK